MCPDPEKESALTLDLRLQYNHSSTLEHISWKML